MINNLIKIALVILGNGILVDAIISEMDGVGRFAMILFGVLFSVAGAFIPYKKK